MFSILFLTLQLISPSQADVNSRIIPEFMNGSSWFYNTQKEFKALPHCKCLKNPSSCSKSKKKASKNEKNKNKKLKPIAEMRPTVYDDGKSCPDQCKKPHVVFDSRHNGTPHAYDPKTSDPESKSFKPCKKKNDCRICFKAGNHCMNIQYQGGGPAYGRFDFPVIFYKQHCKDRNLPPQIKKKCSGILKNLEKIQADTKRINCFKDTKNKLCKEIMTIANKMKKQDKDIYKACRRDPKKYNSTSGLKPNEKRKYACHYSDMTVYFKSKHKGQACHRHWKLLMPSACGENKYVDRFGLNCCDTRLFWQAALGRSSNCKHFFPFDISKEPAIPIPEEKPKPEDNSIEI